MIKSKIFQLVFILTILCVITLTVKSKSQTLTFHRDSTAQGMTYVNALATDSLNGIYNLPVKVSIPNSNDHGDSVHGACFDVVVMSISYARCITFFTQAVNIYGQNYTGWDKNDDSETYQIVQSAFASKGIYFTWQN